MPWSQGASCYGINDDTFFPGDNGEGASLSAMHRTCFDCRVKDECRLAGLGEDFGIWGNSSPTERRAMRRVFESIMDFRGEYEHLAVYRRWSERVLRLRDLGDDLTTAMRKMGATDHMIQALLARTKGDRFAAANLAKQEEIHV